MVSAGVVQGQQAGVGQGPTTIRLSGLNGSLPAGYQFWTPFKSRGDSVTVTVTAPPPDILLDEVPIWTPGWHQWTYVGPGTPGPTTWSVDDSRTLHVSPDTVFTSSGWTTQFYVDAGSYTVYIGANGVVREIPVCTASGEALMSQAGKSGSGSTNAVENCPPPGGGGGEEQ